MSAELRLALLGCKVAGEGMCRSKKNARPETPALSFVNSLNCSQVPSVLQILSYGSLGD